MSTLRMSSPDDRTAPQDASSEPGLNRVISGRHLDDQYHGHETYTGTRPDEELEEHGEENREEDAEEDEKHDLADLEKHDSIRGDLDGEKEPSEDEASNEQEAGIFGAPISDKDLEAGRLEKSKTSNSRKSKTKDPNLVTWEGPDDPENPKNWPLNRKWAATLVGMILLPNTMVC